MLREELQSLLDSIAEDVDNDVNVMAKLKQVLDGWPEPSGYVDTDVMDADGRRYSELYAETQAALAEQKAEYRRAFFGAGANTPLAEVEADEFDEDPKPEEITDTTGLFSYDKEE